MSQPEWLKQWTFILTYLKAGSAESGCQHGWILGKGLLSGPVLTWLFLGARRERGGISDSFSSYNPWWGPHPHDLN